MKSDLAQRLNSFREAHGLTQEQLAQELHVSRQAISKWECGDAVPDLDNLTALSRLYRVSLDELVGNKAEDEAKTSIHVSLKDGVNVQHKNKGVHVGWDGIQIDDAFLADRFQEAARDLEKDNSSGARTSQEEEHSSEPESSSKKEHTNKHKNSKVATNVGSAKVKGDNTSHDGIYITDGEIWLDGVRYDNLKDAHDVWNKKKRRSAFARIPVIPLLILAFFVLGLLFGEWLLGLGIVAWSFVWSCLANVVDAIYFKRGSKKICNEVSALIFSCGLSGFLFFGFAFGEWAQIGPYLPFPGWYLILIGLFASIAVHLVWPKSGENTSN